MEASDELFDTITAAKPTIKQLKYIQKLCDLTGEPYKEPDTQQEAAKQIHALKQYYTNCIHATSEFVSVHCDGDMFQVYSEYVKEE